MDPFTFISLVVVILLIPTAYAAFIGAPYAPTLTAVINKTFDEIKLGRQDTIIDLGAGDGKVVTLAARRGAKSIGYELSPFMWAVAWLRALRYPNARVLLRNFFKQNLTKTGANIIFVFLMPQNMERLKQYLATQSLPQGKYLLSYMFPLKNVKPLKTVRAAKTGPIYIYDLKSLTK